MLQGPKKDKLLLAMGRSERVTNLTQLADDQNTKAENTEGGTRLGMEGQLIGSALDTQSLGGVEAIG